MILLPNHVNMILLSATIDSPELFGTWLGNLKQKQVHLIGTTYRIVPLKHVVVNQDKSYSIIMDEKDKFYSQKYRSWLQSEKQIHKDHKIHKQTVANRDEGQVIGKEQGKVVIHSYTHKMNELIRLMEEREQLPALFLVDCPTTSPRRTSESWRPDAFFFSFSVDLVLLPQYQNALTCVLRT
jgi:superfamily II RNA helicase